MTRIDKLYAAMGRRYWSTEEVAAFLECTQGQARTAISGLLQSLRIVAVKPRGRIAHYRKSGGVV